MTRIAKLTLAALGLTAGAASAQVVIVHSPPRVVYAPRPVVFVPQPVVTYSSPVVSFSAPGVVEASPVVTSYYPGTTTTYSYYPSTTVYSAPAAVAAPGVVTTRTYVGFGIFRPRGVHTETYFRPYVR